MNSTRICPLTNKWKVQSKKKITAVEPGENFNASQRKKTANAHAQAATARFP